MQIAHLSELVRPAGERGDVRSVGRLAMTGLMSQVN